MPSDGTEPPLDSFDVPPNPTTDEEFAALPVLDLDAFHRAHCADFYCTCRDEDADDYPES